MLAFQYFAGFGPKDLMVFLYLPAFGILLIGSIIVLLLKRNGHPYSLAMLVFPLAALGWYLYDKFSSRQVDRSQAMLLGGAIIVIGMYALASSSLIPEEDSAVNAIALLATASAFIFLIAAIMHHKK